MVNLRRLDSALIMAQEIYHHILLLVEFSYLNAGMLVA